MAVELKFSKFDNTPWGFRLVGGCDFDTPLTVIKVSEGSLAEEAGMRLGDSVVCVNAIATAELTHAQAHEIISQAGNNFSVTVFRGAVDTAVEPILLDQGGPPALQIAERPPTESPLLPPPGEPPVLQIAEPPSNDSEVAQLTASSAEGQTKNISIPEMDSLKVQPTSESSSSRPVSPARAVQLRYSVAIEKQTLTETVEERKVLDKKWTTFLQKPDRPKQKPKEEATVPVSKDPPYRVIIKKIKKAKDMKDEAGKNSSTSVQPEEIPMPVEETEERPATGMSDRTGETEQISEMQTVEDELESRIIEQNIEELSERPPEPIAEVDLSMEDQLAQVQKQLLALSQLPAAIQATLDAVTQQLSKIVKAPAENGEAENADAEVTVGGETEHDQENTDAEAIETEMEDDGLSTDVEENPSVEIVTEAEPEPTLVPTPEPEEQLTPEERAKRDKQEKMLAQQVEEQLVLEDQHQRRLKQRPSFPSTPLQRPIVLPGGRKWRAPGDAYPIVRNTKKYTDELIAETISSQSEIITGTTLGVNFLKFQPPPKNLDHLQRSEVYKMVHSLDLPMRGIAGRPSLVNAEEDFYKEQQKSVGAHEEVEVIQDLPAQMEP